MSKQKLYTKVLKDAEGHLPPTRKRGNMSKELYIFLHAVVVLTLICFSLREGFYSFSGTVSIFIQASATSLRDRNPIAAGLFFGVLVFCCVCVFVFFFPQILCGSYFAFALMRTLLEGCSAADLCKSSKVQLFHLPFKRDDQSSWWGTWGAGSAPN